MSLKIVNLSKRYKDRWVLRDVSIDIESGEIFGLAGPSGSGKTALLDTILGTSPVTTGSIYLDERNVTKLDREARRFTAPRPADGSMWQRLFRNGGAASRGERRRIVLDDAIDKADKLLVLDEPFAFIDARSRDAVAAKIREAAAGKGVTVIFASSDFEQVLELCDRAAVMVGGEIKQVGAPAEIYEMPTSRSVASVTGRNNLFPARRLTSSKAEVPEFQTLEGSHRLFTQRIGRGALGALHQNVILGIRPEHISISFGASFPADNLLKATVTGIRFLGPTTLVDLDTGGLKLEARVLRLVGLKVGDECMVGLPPKQIRIFRD